MLKTDVIIVGGGPAGSTCAWQLKRNGVDCIILEKETFPRPKLCAGWITSRVLKNLEINIPDYPYGLLIFSGLHISLPSLKFKLPTTQYSIRRYEFDNWLLQRSEAKVYTHEVKTIKQTSDRYCIDGKFQSKYLVGAGGTFCPVYRNIFRPFQPHKREDLIVSLEQEFEYDYRDEKCYLWFLENDLPGYSWYVPKSNGIINIGIGGMADKSKQKNLKFHWDSFIQKLDKLELVRNYSFKPGGYSYYKRNNYGKYQKDNAFVIGDAAGLATADMAEGIGPSIESGILAANAILNNKQYTIDSVTKYSFKISRLLKLFKKNKFKLKFSSG